MKLVVAAALIALAYLVELVALAYAVAGASAPVWSALSFPLFFAGAALTFAKARGDREEALKTRLDVCLVLTGVGVTLYAFAMSVFFDIATLAPGAAMILPALAALAGLGAMAALGLGLRARFRRAAP